MGRRAFQEVSLSLNLDPRARRSTILESFKMIDVIILLRWFPPCVNYRLPESIRHNNTNVCLEMVDSVGIMCRASNFDQKSLAMAHQQSHFLDQFAFII